MPQRRSGGVRRLIFTGVVQTNLFNAYTPGSGVGGQNASVRRALSRRATLSAGTLDNMKTRTPGCGQCNNIVGVSSNTNSNNNTNIEKDVNKVDPIIPFYM